MCEHVAGSSLTFVFTGEAWEQSGHSEYSLGVRVWYQDYSEYKVIAVQIFIAMGETRSVKMITPTALLLVYSLLAKFNCEVVATGRSEIWFSSNMASRSSRAEARAEAMHYAVAKRILDACSSVQEDLNRLSRNAAEQFLKDERYFQWKVAEALDSQQFDSQRLESQRLEFELEYRPSSSKDKRSIRIDALVKDEDGGKVLVEMKKQRNRHPDQYVETSVRDQLLRLVIQTQLEGGLAMFLWIGDDSHIGHWDDFLDIKRVPACQRIYTDRNDRQIILEKVRMRLGMDSNRKLIRKYGEGPVTDMRLSGIRIYRMGIGMEIRHQQLYIRAWIIDPKYRDVEYRPTWITSETKTADIRFCMDTKETSLSDYRTDVKIIYGL